MSVEHLAVVLHHSKAKGTHKLVLLGIANHMGDGGAWPSVATLARYANVTERSVQRSIQWLQDHGEISVSLQDGGGRDQPDHARPNRYHVHVSCPAWCDRSTNHRDTRPRQGGLHLVGGDTGVTPGDTGVTPPVTLASPKPSLEPTPPLPPPPDHRPCQECGQDQARCQAPQTHWAMDDRHAYRPTEGHTRAYLPPAPARRRRAAR